MSKVNKDVNDLRYRFRPFEEKLDIKVIDEFKSNRDKHNNRSELKIHNRFPSLQPLLNDQSYESVNISINPSLKNDRSNHELSQIL